MIHRDALIEQFEGKPFPQFQRWSSWSTSSGEVMLRYRECGHVERCEVLESIGQPRHDIERLSRIDWYASRQDGYDVIDLWQVKSGVESAVLVPDTNAAHEFFSYLFREADGFDLTSEERLSAEREADEHNSTMLSHRRPQ